ncbi:hypothetical protein A9X03_15390 [Mycobacterium sp. E1715]|uniref:hypothetical protein n=1 Tax=Mycobacterium sp. E1715 TaxID=1856863 RepID=UPI0007FD155E|nr:hypothetical protein [Mycobacterium sp. E1715]OBH22495.1 hypothetical protein A9X03_15390 [Mycobacterium sp. E1715]
MRNPNPRSVDSLQHSMASDVSWANTIDRTARTAPARRAADARFLALADGDVKRAESLRRAHFKRMALKSIAVRQAKAAARKSVHGETV